MTAKPLFLRFASLCAAAALVAAISPAQSRDPEAVELARSMMEAMGGEGAWDQTQYVRFDFKVRIGGELRASRSHLWDKWSGRYRYEQETEDGKLQAVLFNVNDKQGSSYVDGEERSGEEASKAIDDAYKTYINDVYWLAMPWKWLDPGVNLKYLGEKERGGQQYDVVELTFNEVGLTPDDTYRAFVSKDSGLMSYWEYTLENGNEGAWDWEYGTYGGVKLASTHTNAEGAEIDMGEVAVFDEVDGAFFTDPARTLDQLP